MIEKGDLLEGQTALVEPNGERVTAAETVPLRFNNGTLEVCISCDVITTEEGELVQREEHRWVAVPSVALV